MLASKANEAQMAFVQIAHRRHERNMVARMTPVTQLLAQCFCGADYLQGMIAFDSGS
jgi:hypothetical protein